MGYSNLDVFVDHVGSRSLNVLKGRRLRTFKDMRFCLILVPTLESHKVDV